MRSFSFLFSFRCSGLYSFLVGGLLVAAFPARAQTSFGLRLGVNAAGVAFEPGASSAEASLTRLLGGQLGVAVDERIGPRLTYQFALLFGQKGYAVTGGDRNNYVNTTTRGDTLVTTRSIFKFKGHDYVRLNYLEIPLNFVYSFVPSSGFQLILGPYVAVGVGGRSHSDGYTIDQETAKSVGGSTVSTTTQRLADYGVQEVPVSYFTFGGSRSYSSSYNPSYSIRRLDIGFNFGAGFQSGPVQVQALYGWGFSNLLPRDYYSQTPDYKLHHRVGQLTLTYLMSEK